jgi:MFS family permease
MPPIDALSHRRKKTILAICCLSLFIVGLDITIVNVALPSIGQDLDAGTSQLQWTVSSFTVVMASLLMLSGSMADRFGRKRTFTLGLAVFSLASVLCALASERRGASSLPASYRPSAAR